jgi:pyruvate,water dikinase
LGSLNYTFNLENIQGSNKLIVGGKAYYLSKMIGVGLNVPRGFVITSHAFDYFIHKNKLAKVIESVSTSSRNFTNDKTTR